MSKQAGKEDQATINEHVDTNERADLEKIRLILFGEESREQRARIEELRGSVERELNKLKATIDSRIADLRTATELEQDQLATRLVEAEKSRSDDVAGIKEDIAALGSSSRAEFERLEAHISSVTESLKSAFAQSLGQQNSRLENLVESLRHDTDQRLSGVETKKTSRKALADLFEGLAQSLRADNSSGDK